MARIGTRQGRLSTSSFRRDDGARTAAPPHGSPLADIADVELIRGQNQISGIAKDEAITSSGTQELNSVRRIAVLIGFGWATRSDIDRSPGTMTQSSRLGAAEMRLLRCRA